MAIIEIPTRTDIAAYTYEITLDERLYTLQFAYVQRIERWIMNIYDSAKNLLLAGITLHSNTDLISRFTDPNLPQGKFVCHDIEGKNKSATRDNLGSRVKLLYQEAV